LITSGAATPSGGDWREIVFNPDSSDNLLDYVTIEYGGGGIAFRNPSVKINTSSLTMSNSSINRGLEDGLAITDASPTINTTTFSNNGERALDIYGSSFPQLSDLSADGNGFNGAVINGGTVNTDYSWGAAISNYLVTDQVTVNTGVTLTVVPGTTVNVDNPNTDFLVNGILMAQGTAAAPIRFTSGDATPGPGDWGQIIFNPGSNDSLLAYVTVEYGGGFGVAGIEIAGSSVTIRHSTIARHDDEGIRVRTGGPTIINNNIVENDGFGMVNAESDSPVTATCNWWGAASGPTNTNNPAGTGQQISSGVIFDPWLVAPAPGGACSGTRPGIYLPIVLR